MTTFTQADKVRARHALGHAVAAGKVIPQPCRCGATENVQGHHHDYSKPLEVEWLCAKCHSQHHNQKYPLTKECTNCGETFTPKPTKRARAQVCSDACRSEQLSRKLTANPTIPRWAKLDKSKADAIRTQKAANPTLTIRALGREHGVHHSQIGCILRGEAWK